MASQAKLRAVSPRSRAGCLVLQPQTELGFLSSLNGQHIVREGGGREINKWPHSIHKHNKLQASITDPPIGHLGVITLDLKPSEVFKVDKFPNVNFSSRSSMSEPCF